MMFSIEMPLYINLNLWLRNSKSMQSKLLREINITIIRKPNIPQLNHSCSSLITHNHFFFLLAQIHYNSREKEKKTLFNHGYKKYRDFIFAANLSLCTKWLILQHLASSHYHDFRFRSGIKMIAVKRRLSFYFDNKDAVIWYWVLTCSC